MPREQLDRIRRIAGERGLDGLIAFAPDNFQYLTGFQPASQKPVGTFMAVVPSDPSRRPAMTVSSFEESWGRLSDFPGDIHSILLWVEIDDVEALEQGTTTIRPKPVQHDEVGVFRTLAEMLKTAGLEHGRVGADLAGLPAGLTRHLQAGVAGAQIEDATGLFWDLRSIKTPSEVAALRTATQLAERGIQAIMLDANPRGKTVSQLRMEYQAAILEAVRKDPTGCGYHANRIYLTAGPVIGPNIRRNDYVVRDGDVIWIDCGVMIDGYVSDIGRTFSAGEPSPLVQRIANALEAGCEAGARLVRAGARMSEVFTTTQDAIRSHGLPTYTRGHHGHAVGIGFGEQPPFITAGESRPLEANMVIALERPYYVRGLGGFQMEDNGVVTDTGFESFNSLPLGLVVV